MRTLCLSAVDSHSTGILTTEELLSTFTEKQHPAKNALYRQHYQACSVTYLLEGCIKTAMTNAAGEDTVLGFYQAGSFVGLDALSAPQHTMNTVCLTPVRSIRIPLPALAMNDALHDRVFSALNHELQRVNQHLHLVLKNDVKTRVAQFLLQAGSGFAEHPLQEHIHLPMGRHDIASYLGMALETLSRCLMHFQQEGVIQFHRQHIQIINDDALHDYALH